MNRKPLGKPVSFDLKRNCMLCSRWVTCRDPNKTPDYACSKFSKDHDFSLDDLFEKEAEDEAKAVKVSSSERRYQKYKFNSTIDIEELEKQEADGSISSMIDEVLSSGSPVPPDLRIDDRDIPRAVNVVEWMTSPKFIGGEQKPFAKQIQVAAHSMAEWCPRCSDEDYFECVPVDDTLDDILESVEFLEKGKCPRCKAMKADMIEDEELIDPFEVIGIVGQRGTKSTTTSMLESYMQHKWVLTPNLPATFKVLTSSVFTGTYTATTFGQAKGSFWDPLNAIFLESEWYRNYHKFLDEIGRKTGEELYKHSETMLTYRHKNIFLAPASPSQRSLRGKTRLSSVVDEAGWLKMGSKKSGGEFEMMNGNEVYTALKRSLSTMRAAYMRRRDSGYSNIPKPILYMISSPSARNDLIMTRFRKSQGSKEVYAFKYSTWTFNPLLPRKVFDEEFRTNPVEAARDYGCEPPMAANPWITDQELVESSFTGKRNAVEVTQARGKTKSKRLVTVGTYKTKVQPTHQIGAIMGIDAGVVNNSFAFSINVPTHIPDPDDDEEEDVLVGMDTIAVGEIIPKQDYPVSFTKLYRQVLLPLCQEFHVAAVVSDRWQNRKVVEDLEDTLGIDFFEIRLDMQNFTDYREGLYNKIISNPKLERKMEDILDTSMDHYPDCFKGAPVSHLCYQMMTVQSTGSAVVKNDEGATDDILRACVIAHTALQDEEILELCENFVLGGPVAAPRRALAAISSGTGRGSGNARVGNSGVLVRGSQGTSATKFAGGVLGRR